MARRPRDASPKVPARPNSGFRLDAEVGIGARDRAGLQRLLRYRAGSPVAVERLDLIDDQYIIYRLPRAQRDGRTVLSLAPLELIDHLAALIPPPKLHRHRYHGVRAPNSPLRAVATADGREPASAVASPHHLPPRRQALASALPDLPVVAPSRAIPARRSPGKSQVKRLFFCPDHPR